MKKIILILICLLLSSCSIKTNDEPSDTSISESIEPTITPTPIQTHFVKEDLSGSNWQYTGDGYFNSEKNIMEISHYNGDGSIVYYDELYLNQGHNIISFSIDEGASFLFEILDDEDNVFYSEKILSDGNSIQIEIDNTKKELYSAIVKFSDFISDSESIKIKEFLIERENEIINIHLNQLGYTNDQRKVAIFPFHHGNYFNIKRVSDNSIVASYDLTKMMKSIDTDEFVSYGEFTDFNESGEFYLESSFGFKSYPFVIDENVYQELSKDLIKSFTIQRCGMDIPQELSKEMAHPACHQDIAHIYYHNYPIDVTGGWHDAGDYGRYIDTGFKALSDMLLAFIDNEDAFDDNTNIIDSNNGIKDILDEIKYELDWMMKMQDPTTGGIHSVASSMNFADIVSPEEDKNEVIVFETSPITSAEVASVMAIASKAFEKYDKEYSQKCLDVATKAFDFALYNDGVKNLPGEYKAGNYIDASLNYYRYYMGIAMWYATDNNEYYDYAMKQIDINDYNIYTLYWCPLLMYPSYLILKNADSTYQNYDVIKKIFLDLAYSESSKIRSNPYRINVYDVLTWGSNQNISDIANLLMMAYNLTNDLELYDNATELLDYLLGKNCLNKSFVTGYGEDYPQNLHHRTTISKKTNFKGVMVGGPNMSMEDQAMIKAFKDKNMKSQWMYLDDEDSYSTNETAIQHNSSLIYLLSNIK